MSLHSNRKILVIPVDISTQKTQTGSLKQTAAVKPTKKGKVSAQNTAFLRRRKVVKALMDRANGLVEHPEPNSDLEIFSDYPILDITDDFESEITPQQYHARQLLTPEYDSNLSDEFWTIQGAVIGTQMDRLPVTTHTGVHSMDLMY